MGKKKREKVLVSALTNIDMTFSVGKKTKKVIKAMNKAVNKALSDKADLDKPTRKTWRWEIVESSKPGAPTVRLMAEGPIAYYEHEGDVAKSYFRGRFVSAIVKDMADIGSELLQYSMNEINDKKPLPVLKDSRAKTSKKTRQQVASV